MKYLKGIIFTMLMMATINQGLSLDLNYRVIDDPKVKRQIEETLAQVQIDFFSMLTSTALMGTDSNYQKLLEQTGQLIMLKSALREECIYQLEKNASQALIDQCQQRLEQIRSLLIALDINLLSLLTNHLLALTPQSTQSNLAPSPQPKKKASKAVNVNVAREVYPPSFIQRPASQFFIDAQVMALTFQLPVILAKLINQTTFYRAQLIPHLEVWKRFTSDYYGQLSAIEKLLRGSLLVAFGGQFKQEIADFWSSFIEPLAEKYERQNKIDYWTINIFDLNLRLNQYYYACERTKAALPSTFYSTCDRIHSQWNNLLRLCLKQEQAARSSKKNSQVRPNMSTN